MVAERENIGPSTSVDLTVELAAGTYTLRCKPGMKGDGINSSLTVTGGAAPAASAAPRHAQAVAKYRTYVEAQARQSLSGAKDLQAALAAGDVAKAKKLYASSRIGWERMEPVAEAFGDVDPKVDLREADLEAGQQWTGWHVIEKTLWTTNSAQGTAPVAAQLVTDLTDLVGRIGTAEITPTSMANGAKELLDEVATGKVTGEEEAFSHTDLVDFQANVDGARMVVDLLGPVLTEKDASLHSDLVSRFEALQTLLARYGQNADFVSYDKVTPAQRQELADAVDALAEPLSRVAATVVKA
ncbi:MAG: iron uptake system protein EfeO [Kineosporiaceae bacterium]